MNINSELKMNIIIRFLYVASFYISYHGADGFFSGFISQKSNKRFGIQTQLSRKSNLNVASYNMEYPMKFSDDEEEGEETQESDSPAVEIADLDEADSPEMSIFKEGIKFPTSLNGSDVRVGIIMARWNADVIQGLYKVKKRYICK